MELKDQRTKPESLPKIEELEGDIKRLGIALRDHFQSEERLKEMTFQERRKMLDLLFPPGKDEENEDYGVYVWKNEENEPEIFINAVLNYPSISEKPTSRETPSTKGRKKRYNNGVIKSRKGAHYGI